VQFSLVSPKSSCRDGFKAAAVFAAAFALLSVTGDAAFADQGYVLTQRSTKMGDQYVYVSDQGLKISNPKAGFNLVTHAPNWDITLFNDKTRCFYETTAEQYRQRLAGKGADAELRSSNWSKAGDTQILGLKATEYRMGAKAVRSKNKSGAVVTKSIAGAQYWVASDIAIPPKLTDLLSAAYGLPSSTSTCVPLRLKYSEADGSHTVLETYRVDKTPISVSYFDKPSGYKLVQSDAEVMMDDEQKQILNDMMRDTNAPPSSGQAPAQIAAPAASQQPAQAGQAGGTKQFTKEDVNKLIDIFRKKQ
jgi:hypothetical protein